MKNVKDDKNKCDRKVIITPDKKTQNEGSDDIPFIIKLLGRLLSSGKDKTHGICFFMFNSGFRFAEIIDIKFSDVDFIKGTLKIGMAKRNIPNKEKVSRTLNHESLAVLERIRDKYPNDKWVFQAGNSDNQINKKSRSLSFQSVMNTINQNTEHKLSLKSFRHAYASNYCNQLTSPSIIDIKNNLGHETINTTINYIKN
jgi:integrase